METPLDLNLVEREKHQTAERVNHPFKVSDNLLPRDRVDCVAVPIETKIRIYTEDRFAPLNNNLYTCICAVRVSRMVL